jgi:transcriptional regulator with XRE-family HTH domain
MTRGEKIKLLMTKNKMSVKELAEKIDIADSYLYKIINDKIKKPDDEIFHKMARAFNCTIEEILTNDVDEERIYYDDPNIFKHLPPDLQEFVVKEESTPYLTVAKMLEGYNLDKITPFQMNVLIEWLRDAIK